jgi:hypothetical protein
MGYRLSEIGDPPRRGIRETVCVILAYVTVVPGLMLFLGGGSTLWGYIYTPDGIIARDRAVLGRVACCLLAAGIMGLCASGFAASGRLKTSLLFAFAGYVVFVALMPDR